MNVNKFDQEIFKKDINKLCNHIGDFKRNQKAVFREEISKLRDHWDVLGRNQSIGFLNGITFDLFVKVIIFWSFGLENDFCKVRRRIYYKQFLIGNDSN